MEERDGKAASEFAQSIGAVRDPISGVVEIDPTNEGMVQAAAEFVKEAVAQGCTCPEPEVHFVMVGNGEASMLLGHDEGCPLLEMLTVDDSKPV